MKTWLIAIAFGQVISISGPHTNEAVCQMAVDKHNSWRIFITDSQGRSAYPKYKCVERKPIMGETDYD